MSDPVLAPDETIEDLAAMTAAAGAFASALAACMPGLSPARQFAIVDTALIRMRAALRSLHKMPPADLADTFDRSIRVITDQIVFETNGDAEFRIPPPATPIRVNVFGTGAAGCGGPIKREGEQ